MEESAHYRRLADIPERSAKELTLLKDLRHRLMTTKPLPPAAPLSKDDEVTAKIATKLVR